MITNDAVIFAMLVGILGIIFKTERMPQFKKFYRIIPSLLLCYFLPSLLNTFGIIDISDSKVYFIASRYFLPASLILLTLSIDLKLILALGPKALIMFLTATVGIVLGGPLAIWIYSIFDPEMFSISGLDAIWRGLATVAGSWIGGGANQMAMKEIFAASDKIFSAMIAVDVFVAKISMAFWFYGAANQKKFNKWFKADDSAVETIKVKMTAFQEKIARIPQTADLMYITAIAFGFTGLSHLLANNIAPFLLKNAPYLRSYSLTSQFFWLIILATTFGVILSFTKVKNLEGAGASKFGSVLIYLLVASIGMKMDAASIFQQPSLFVVGTIWIVFHILLLVLVGRLIKAPFFFTAVGSQANVGGAASAPVVAAAFHPSLAPMGVMLAVAGYALGTYGAYICAIMMKFASN